MVPLCGYHGVTYRSDNNDINYFSWHLSAERNAIKQYAEATSTMGAATKRLMAAVEQVEVILPKGE